MFRETALCKLDLANNSLEGGEEEIRSLYRCVVIFNTRFMTLGESFKQTGMISSAVSGFKAFRKEIVFAYEI